ncbi:MAG: VanZ family protein [Eubacteriales bacterium]
MGVILIFLLMPVSSGDDGESGLIGQILSYIPFADKIVHAVLFAILALINGMENRKNTQKVRLMWAVYLCFFAVVTEFLQKLTGYRSFDLYDIMADCFGIFVVVVLSIKRPKTKA